MSLERIRIFMEQLFKFCLGRRGIVWHPARLRDAQAAHADPLFQDIIGNAVLNTSIEFEQDVDAYSTVIMDDVDNLLYPTSELVLSDSIISISDDIIANPHYESQTQAIYIFLAVMVDVAIQYARAGNHQIVNFFVLVVALIFDHNIPFDFIQNFDIFLMYALNHGQPPGN